MIGVLLYMYQIINTCYNRMLKNIFIISLKYESSGDVGVVEENYIFVHPHTFCKKKRKKKKLNRGITKSKL